MPSRRTRKAGSKMFAAMIPLSDFILMVAYAIGVILSPFILGLIWKEKLNIEDCFPIACLSVVWPLALGVILIVAVGITVVLLGGFLFSFPFELGQWVRHAIQKRKQTKQERKELEHAKKVQNAKPGDREYFDYVCD